MARLHGSKKLFPNFPTVYQFYKLSYLFHRSSLFQYYLTMFVCFLMLSNVGMFFLIEAKTNLADSLTFCSHPLTLTFPTIKRAKERRAEECESHRNTFEHAVDNRHHRRRRRLLIRLSVGFPFDLVLI